MLDAKKERDHGKQNRFEAWMESVKRVARTHDTDVETVLKAIEMLMCPRSNDRATLHALLRWEETREFATMAVYSDG